MTGFLLFSYGALWILVIVLSILVVLMYRHFGMMSMGTLEGVQRDGLAVGTVAPGISGITAEGVDRGWEPRLGHPQLLLFAAPDCEPCATVMPIVNKLANGAQAATLGVAVIVPGPKAEAVRMQHLYQPPYLCLAEDGSGAFTRFLVRVTPFGFIIGGDGRVLAKGLCGDASRLKDLLEAAGLASVAAAVPVAGQPLRLSGVGSVPVSGRPVA